MQYTKEQIAACLDFAVLKPTTSRFDVIQACLLAEKEKFASVCVRPCDVGWASSFECHISTVIGFPHGANSKATKIRELQQTYSWGADEFDIVMNFARFKDGCIKYVKSELEDIVSAILTRAGRPEPVFKIILETCYLTPEQIHDACKMVAGIKGVSFVKTSTGFGTSGATCNVVEIMKDAIAGTDLQIKASGGINNYQDVQTFLDLGCTRLGSSKWLELLPEGLK